MEWKEGGRCIKGDACEFEVVQGNVKGYKRVQEGMQFIKNLILF
jgi:hypothetical protein